jgi:bacterioferritin-associated ferredoxin
MDLDDKLCYCFHVSKRKIVNFVKQTRPRKASQISQCFGAGTGCGWCIPFLLKIHRSVLRGEPVEAEEITPEEYAAMRSRYREDVATGSRERNSYEPSEPAPAAAEGPAKDAGGDASPTSAAPPSPAAAFDYTRYFSRTRGEPEPETLREAEPRDPTQRGPRRRRGRSE